MATEKDKKKKKPSLVEEYFNMNKLELAKEEASLNSLIKNAEESRKRHLDIVAANRAENKDLTPIDILVPITVCAFITAAISFTPLVFLFGIVSSIFYVEYKFKAVSTNYHKLAARSDEKRLNSYKRTQNILKECIEQKNKAEENGVIKPKTEEDPTLAEQEVIRELNEFESSLINPSTEEEVILDDEEVIDNNSVVTPTTTTTIKNDNEDEEEVEVEVITPNSTSATGLEADADTLSELYHSSRNSSSDVGHVPSSQDTDDGGRSM